MDSKRGLVSVLYTLVILLFCLVERGLSIKCYLCTPSPNIHTPEICEKLPSLPAEEKIKYLQDCNNVGANYTMCRKMHQEISGDTRVYYGCARLGEIGCIQRAGTYKIRSTNCHCDVDECNGTSNLQAPVYSALCLTSLVILLINMILAKGV